MRKTIIALAILSLGVAFTGCASAPVPATEKQTAIANAVEDTLSIGLVPVLTKNRAYVPAAKAVAEALGAVSGEALTTAGIEAFLAPTNLAPEDKATVIALVNAAWDTYSRRYAQQVGAQIRPDVKLFAAAVAGGITRAISALPPPAS